MDSNKGDKPISDHMLNVVLKEYELLREELLQKYRHHMQIFAILVSAMAIITGYIISERAYDIFYLIPIFIIPLLYRYIYEQCIATTMGRYIRDELIEKRLAETIGKRKSRGNRYDPHWLGWEHYYLEWEERRYKKIGIPRYFDYAAIYIFILLPFGLSLFYSIVCILSLSKVVNIQLHSYLPLWLHIVILTIYMFIAIFLNHKIINEGKKILYFNEKKDESNK